MTMRVFTNRLELVDMWKKRTFKWEDITEIKTISILGQKIGITIEHISPDIIFNLGEDMSLRQFLSQ